MPQILDLTGQKFGRLTVLERTEKRPRAWWKCVCECGKETETSGESLGRGYTKSCGCLSVDNATAMGLARRKHVDGWKPTPEQAKWKSMKSRCYSTSHTSYKYYGALGVTVCPEWLGENGFNQFLADMGPKPSPLHSIDRIKTELGYSKNNCRWTTKDVQQRNTTVTNNLTINGRTMCAKDWAAEAGISYTTLLGRLKRHWTPEEAISRPVDGRFRWREDEIQTPPVQIKEDTEVIPETGL